MTDSPSPEQNAPVVARPCRGGRTAPTISALVGLVMAMLVVLLVTREPATERIGDSRLIDRLAPAVAGETLDGGTVDIDDHRGRWVIVNFMASWCVPCKTEHPELVAFDEAHRVAGDAVLVGVTFDNDADDARAFFAQRGGDWPVIDDPENSIGVAFGVLQPPETFVIAPNGTVVERFVGAITQDDLDAVIQFFERGGR